MRDLRGYSISPVSQPSHALRETNLSISASLTKHTSNYKPISNGLTALNQNWLTNFPPFPLFSVVSQFSCLATYAFPCTLGLDDMKQKPYLVIFQAEWRHMINIPEFSTKWAKCSVMSLRMLVQLF